MSVIEDYEKLAAAAENRKTELAVARANHETAKAEAQDWADKIKAEGFSSFSELDKTIEKMAEELRLEVDHVYELLNNASSS